jgi:hypothetical protein
LLGPVVRHRDDGTVGDGIDLATKKGSNWTTRTRFASGPIDKLSMVDAARIEPVFTLKFPASREFSREFFEKRASEGDSRI